MKNYNKKLLALGILLVAVTVLLVFNLIKDGRYYSQISNPFSDIVSQATTTLTCEFSESSNFIYSSVKGYDYIKHGAGRDKNGTSITVTFRNIGSDKPQLIRHPIHEYGKTIGDTEPVNLLGMKLSNVTLLVEEGYGGPTFYYLYPIQKVAVMQQSTIEGPQSETVVAFDSMGYCH